MKNQRLPQTDSIEELSRFWQTHDLTEFEDQLEEVPEAVFERRPEAIVTVRLRPEEAKEVKRIAQARGVRQGILIRRWVLEKLQGGRSSARRR